MDSAMPIDMNSINSAINSVLSDQQVTPQVNVSGSQLTIVLNRRKGCSAEYESLSQKIITVLRRIDIAGLDVIKFYGREPGKKPEWQTTTNLFEDDREANPSSKSDTQITSRKPKTILGVETEPKNFLTLSWSFFTIGMIMMGIGLVYDTAPNGTHNIGMINAKETYTNTGGYLAVCGAVLVHHFSSKCDQKE